jgi:SAM-dependent methyltransferase
MITVESVALQYPSLTRVPTAIFDAVTSWGLASLNRRILSQFRQPRGWAGHLVGGIMTLEHAPVTAWTLDLLQPKAGERVLDAGCGSGQALRAIARRMPEGELAGIDYSATMVAQARRRNRKLIEAGRCRIEQADIAALPFADATYDKISTIETLYFWQDPAAAFAELQRVLKPAGRLAAVLEYTREGNDAAQMELLEQQGGLRVYSQAQVEALFRNAGFVDVKASFVAAKGWLYVEGTRPTATASVR